LPDETDAAGLWVTTSTGDVPGRRKPRRERAVTFSLSSRDDDDEDKPSPILVQLNESVPAPCFVDWDGDGDLDLLTQLVHHMVVWKAGSAGQFPPRRRSRWRCRSTPTARACSTRPTGSHAVDLDGDKRADCVVFAATSAPTTCARRVCSSRRARRSERAAVRRGRQAARRARIRRLHHQPAVRGHRRDGLPDLTLRAVRPDLIDQLRSATSRSIEADLFVYRNVKGTFRASPTWCVGTTRSRVERFELSSEFLAT